jgi:uncharacterized protein (TIGR01244 family)
MPTRRAFLLTLGAALAGWTYCCVPAAAADASVLQAPNVVPISAQLVTSGQPTAAALAQLAAQGFGAVIYLAPLTVADAVADEPAIVQRQGMEFVHIPIQFGKPTEADVQAFVAAMRRLHGRKVLVHCQINMRASSMTFLYRVLEAHEAPEPAYEAVTRVWSPQGVWKDLLTTQLAQAGIAFDPY